MLEVSLVLPVSCIRTTFLNFITVEIILIVGALLLSFAFDLGSKRNLNISKMSSFVEVPAGSDFPLENLPYGVFSTADNVSLIFTSRVLSLKMCFINSQNIV